MQSISIDILDTEAIKLLQNLESLNLIRIHKESISEKVVGIQKLKGSMSKQKIADVNKQLKNIRNEWQ